MSRRSGLDTLQMKGSLYDAAGAGAQGSHRALQAIDAAGQGLQTVQDLQTAPGSTQEHSLERDPGRAFSAAAPAAGELDI